MQKAQQEGEVKAKGGQQRCGQGGKRGCGRKRDTDRPDLKGQLAPHLILKARAVPVFEPHCRLGAACLGPFLRAQRALGRENPVEAAKCCSFPQGWSLAQGRVPQLGPSGELCSPPGQADSVSLRWLTSRSQVEPGHPARVPSSSVQRLPRVCGGQAAAWSPHSRLVQQCVWEAGVGEVEAGGERAHGVLFS